MAGGYDTGDLPPVIDVERDPNNKKPPKSMPDDLLACLNDTEARFQTTPMIYTGSLFWTEVIGADARFKRFPFWIAFYDNENMPPVPPDEKPTGKVKPASLSDKAPVGLQMPLRTFIFKTPGPPPVAGDGPAEGKFGGLPKCTPTWNFWQFRVAPGGYPPLTPPPKGSPPPPPPWQEVEGIESNVDIDAFNDAAYGLSALAAVIKGDAPDDT